MTVTIHHGDCLDVMRTMPANSVDSVVTDPPYGIRFMGKAWDGADISAKHAARKNMPSHDPDGGPNGGHKSIAAEAGKYDLSPAAMLAFQAFSEAWAIEAHRVLKPGGYLLAFAGTRTYHRMVCGVEAAGFEVRDRFRYECGPDTKYGPLWSSLGHEQRMALLELLNDQLGLGSEHGWVFGSGFPKSHNGPWGGTALKPAHEPIVVARKPLSGTVASNVLAYGTGALNIDACRVGTENTRRPMGELTSRGIPGGGFGAPERLGNRGIVGIGGSDAGRWPANVIHDGSDEAIAGFSTTTPSRSGGRSTKALGRMNDDGWEAQDLPRHGYDDYGTAARFFYCAKASKSDRDAGLDDMPAVFRPNGNKWTDRDYRVDAGERGADRESGPRRNTHPTVKPTDLMRYLCRLVTPSGGVVLDPFMGSGSTGRGAIAEGFGFVGIELDPAYIEIARRRIDAMQPGLSLHPPEVAIS